MLDATRPFRDSVEVVLPYLQARSVGGTLMTLGHLVFALNLLGLAFVAREDSANAVAAE